MRKIAILLVFLPILAISQAQQEEPKFGINFSGFVKNDFFWDTRQNVTIREGHFLLYPSSVNLDAEGNDINARANFNFLSIQSRLTGKITGPDAFKAKTSAMIEADFFGNENTSFSDVNGFRLRHAFAKLNWEKSELLVGQYWHPMFNPGCFPGTVSFNTGSPFQPFSRNPQARFTHKFGKLSALASASAQRDFVSPGAGSTTLRNSAIPDFSAQLHFSAKNEEKNTELNIGLGGGYKIITPRLFSEVTKTTTNVITPESYTIDTNTWIVTHIPEVKQTITSTSRYKTSEKVGGLYSMFFAKYKSSKMTYKLFGVYGQNIFDLTMIGGYAVSGISDSLRNFLEYTPLNTLSAWGEIHTNGKKIQIGVFGGYTQNMGADKTITDYSTTNRGADIHSAYRISPRIMFFSGKMQFMTELEYTAALYATKAADGKINRDAKGVITDSKEVSNLRALLSVQYNF